MHTSYILWCRNSKFGVWLGWWSVTYHFQVTVTLNWPSFKNNDIRSIYLTLFKAGIPNLVCGCMLVWRSVMYHLRVTLNLTSDLVFKKIIYGAYLLYYLREKPQFRCADAWWSIPSLDQCDLEHWPSFKNCPTTKIRHTAFRSIITIFARGVQARLPENSSYNVFLVLNLFYRFTVVFINGLFQN